ncbi:hypothetical protein [Streptomyces sp. H27-C3]|uniref:hypothetical protein n=1 Tax=unclassified Streptomyces TaxID=2593676 RepID=UPI0024BA1E85|nr:hypothetical protein [Streptomyces sp. H27-C3]MDJ0464880.1 hypothetical protein [Streptomyces sp. H27-C3]
MFSFTKEIAAHGAGYGQGRPCAKVCGVGAAEVVLLRQVLGLCLRLSVRLSGDCPSYKGG